MIPSLSGPGVSLCKSRYNIVIWRAENRTHLSKQTRTSTERSQKASNIRGILSRPDDQGVLWFENRICVPDQNNLRQQILREAHESAYSIHPGGTKMYRDLKTTFWWPGLRKDIAYYVACCDICNRVNVEHQKPAGLLQPLQVRQWKWDDICMDFVVGLPRSARGHDSMWVIVDMLTKVAHFIPVKTTYRAD